MTPGTGDKFDHLMKGIKSRVESQESRVETKEIGTEIEPKTESQESRVEIEDSRVNADKIRRVESRVESLDSRAFERAIDEASKKPKLGVYSPIAAAVLRYKAITTPRYSMGSELRVVIEQALKETYPELYEAAETALADLK
jgi:hypothetical protein